MASARPQDPSAPTDRLTHQRRGGRSAADLGDPGHRPRPPRCRSNDRPGLVCGSPPAAAVAEGATKPYGGGRRIRLLLTFAFSVLRGAESPGHDNLEVVPGLVEVEVAVPRLIPALRWVLGDRQVDPRRGTAVQRNYQKNTVSAMTPVLPGAVSIAMAELAGDVQEGLLAHDSRP